MDDLHHIDVRLLPPQMKFLVEIMGLPETIKLLEKKGGLEINIPNGRGDIELSPLYEILSEASIEKLCNSRFAGKRIHLPKADKILDQLRNMDIRCSKSTATKQQLAKKYNLSSRHVQRLWNNQPDSANLDLFDE